VLCLLDRCRLRKRIINVQPALGFDQVGCEEGVDHCGFPETALSCGAVDRLLDFTALAPVGLLGPLTNEHHVESESTLQELVFDLLGDG
jgi:hypothetical protein